MPASEIVATAVFAALVFRYVPAKVSAWVLVGLAGSAVFTVIFVWLDLDKIAGIFGSLAALSALYGIPFFMRDSILAHPPFRALVWGASKESELEVRQAIVAGAQVRALLEDRFNVAREDLQAVALPALRHRLILGFEAQADGITPERLVGDVLSAVQVPRP